MADQLLSIDSSNLESVANEIRTKAGLSSSQKLVFPDTDEQGKLGMISALQSITTEATVTPKISPQQVTLTKDSTSFAINSGFHDGNGTVGITLQSKTVTPNSSQQTVEPDTGKLLSQVIVNAISGGYKMATGTVTVNDTESFSISGLTIHPQIACLLLNNWISDSKIPFWVISHYSDNAQESSYAGWHYYMGGSYANGGSLTAASGDNMVYGDNSITFYKQPSSSSYRYHGTYIYVIWGN